MKFVFISDTHGLHNELVLPKGDILIHGGDISDRGTREEVVAFLNWFGELDYSTKIFIGGNHDIFLDENPVDLLELIPSSVIYLRNSSTTINGIRIWGSPVTPDFESWAFGKSRRDMEEHWKYMPTEIDILLAHTPPAGILDKSSEQRALGCKYLLTKVEAIKPRFHLFGHIHSSYGLVKIRDTEFINGANLHSIKGLVNPPIVFEFEK